MGLDTSSHAVDTALFRDRLVPFVKDGKPVDDLIQRAARVAMVSGRATTWRLSLLRLSWEVRQAQEAVVPQVTSKQVQPLRKQTFLESLFGIKAPTQTKEYTLPERVPGLLGFESDLVSFGRPFLIPGDSARALAVYDLYLHAEGKGDAAVDALARSMLGELTAAATKFPPGTRPAVIEATKKFLPLEAHVAPVRDEDDGPAPTLKDHEARLKRETQLWRAVFANRNSDKPLPAEFLLDDEEEETPARDYLINLPLRMAGFAAELMPGWMSRGYGYATSLFDKIGVKRSHIFETPEPLFKDLVKAAPAMRDALHTTIPENFSLGGYVPPQKMQAFVDLLVKHRRDLILAFDQGPAPKDIEPLAEDYTKILEPATYALKNGYGYLEAAEIYSAPLGMMN